MLQLKIRHLNRLGQLGEPEHVCAVRIRLVAVDVTESLQTAFREAVESRLQHLDITWSPGDSPVPSDALTVMLHMPASRVDAAALREEVASLQQRDLRHGSGAPAPPPPPAMLLPWLYRA